MSANSVRGEVELKRADGSLHVLKLGTAAICRFEELTGKSIFAVLPELQSRQFQLRDIRAFVLASSVGEKPLEEAAANELIDELGVLPVVDAMTDSIIASFKARRKGNGAATENPQTPARKRTAGAGSSRTPQK